MFVFWFLSSASPFPFLSKKSYIDFPRLTKMEEVKKKIRRGEKRKKAVPAYFQDFQLFSWIYI